MNINVDAMHFQLGPEGSNINNLRTQHFFSNDFMGIAPALRDSSRRCVMIGPEGSGLVSAGTDSWTTLRARLRVNSIVPGIIIWCDSPSAKGRGN